MFCQQLVLVGTGGVVPGTGDAVAGTGAWRRLVILLLGTLEHGMV